MFATNTSLNPRKPTASTHPAASESSTSSTFLHVAGVGKIAFLSSFSRQRYFAHRRRSASAGRVYPGSVMQTGGHPFWEAVRALGLPENDYAIFGSGPLAVRGLIELKNDVDIVARGPAWTKAVGLGPVTVARHGDPLVRLHGGRIEVFAGWMEMDIGGIIDRAELIEGLPFARLEDILTFKRALGRAKDLEHIRLIEDHLRGDSP